MLFASSVAVVIMIIEPGTRAVSTPAAPITPTNHGSNAWIDRRKQRQIDLRPSESGYLQDRRKADEEHEYKDELVQRHDDGVLAERLLAPRGEHRAEAVRPHVEAERRQQDGG